MKQFRKSNRIFIKAFVIFSTHLLIIQAGCFWDTISQADCAIACTSSFTINGTETLEQVLADLEEKWQERTNCHNEGIYLRLNDGMDYPNFTVKANWFTAQVRVKELTFHLSSVTTIEVNAFNSTALKYVTKLVFPNMNLNLISKGVFNGLDTLEVLDMDRAFLRVIEMGVLDALNETLMQLTLTQSTRFWPEILIDGFTGSETLKALEYVKFQYNLRSTITHKSFVGLENVKTLDLSECQIVAIGVGAFDPISSSIQELNLKNNLIQTLPEGLFDSMLPSPVTTILLEGNKWHCDCDLIPFKLCLLEYSNFVGPFYCSTPTHLRDYSVIDTDFCDSTLPTTSSTLVPPTPSSPATENPSTSAPPTPSTPHATPSSTSEAPTPSTPDPTTASNQATKTVLAMTMFMFIFLIIY